MERINFEGAVELQQGIMKLDSAEQRQVFTRDDKGREDLAGKYKGIWNIDQNELSCIAGRNYTLIQHKDAFQPVVEAIKLLGLPVEGWIKNCDDRADMMVVFKGAELDIQGDKLKLGVKFHNSYNLSRVFGGEFYAFRVACSNGMILGKVMLEFRQFHRGKINPEQKIAAFMKEAIQINDVLKNYVSLAMQDTYEWEMAEKFLEQAIKRTKWRELIVEELTESCKGRRVTRWDVYNAVTKVATHGEAITLHIEDYLQKNAQKILTKPLVLENE